MQGVICNAFNTVCFFFQKRQNLHKTLVDYIMIFIYRWGGGGIGVILFFLKGFFVKIFRGDLAGV